MGRVIIPLFFALSYALHSSPSSAQSSPEDIIDFFAISKIQNPDQLPAASDYENEAIEIRHALDSILDFSNTEPLTLLIENVSPELNENHPKLVEISKIFKENIVEGELDRPALMIALSDFEAGADWYAGIYADVALSALRVSRMELLLAGQYAQSALDRIPNTVSILVTDAQLILAEQMTVLYGVSANTDRMLETSKTSRQIHTELGLEFNRYELMTNLLLAFNWKRDHEGAEIIAEMMKAEPRPDTVAEGLAEVYIADLFNEVGKYDEALKYAQMASEAKDPLIQRRSIGEGMIANAGAGNISEAVKGMQKLGLWDDGSPTPNSELSEGALHARALIEGSLGNTNEAISLMNRRLDLMIGRMYRINADDTASLLTHLENTRERQVERESALQREAELKAVQLEQKNRLNRLLWVLIGGLTVAFNFLLAFLRYREKNNAKMRGLQEETISAEKMKTQFLGVINHELRTPLNGIIGISDAMIHHAGDDATQKQAKTIQESGQLLHDLLDSLITMSTIEGNRLDLDRSDTDVARDVSDAVAEWTDAASDKGLALTHFVGRELETPVLADAVRLRHCLRFLLSNAVRFTHQGRVHLHATADMDTPGLMQLTVIVADTGQGISDDVQERLFKPFLQADASMTRKYGGAGLSLAIARKLARMMGGDLIVHSREGRGSEFTLTASLPLVSAETELDAPESELHQEISRMKARTEAKRSRSGAETIPALDLNDMDDPETIIDAMLNDQLFGADEAETLKRKRRVRLAS